MSYQNHICTLVTLSSAISLAAPLAPQLAAADWTAPAEFTVLQEVAARNPGAYTASTAASRDMKNKYMNGGSFEPINFRTMVHAQGDASGELVLRPNFISGYNSYQSGLWEGAKMRAYRIMNGRFGKVREDTVRAHHAVGWNHWASGIGNKVLIAPDTTRAHIKLEGYNRKGVDYYFCVKAVNRNGDESPASPAARIAIPADYPGKVELPENKVTPFAAPGKKPEPDLAPPPLAKSFTATLDPATGVITAEWDPVTTEGLVGYRIYQSDVPPEQHQGYRMLLATAPDDPAKHIKKGDMIFLQKRFFNWDRRRVYSHRIFGANGLLPALIPFHGDEQKTWDLVPHPEPVPETFIGRGETCLHMSVQSDETIQILQYNHASLKQNYYRVLDPEKTYVVEFWARQEGLVEGKMTFSLLGPYQNDVAPIPFAVSGAWQHFRAEWQVPHVLDGKVHIGAMGLSFQGPAEVWLDNVRVYEKGAAYNDYYDADYAALAASGMGALRGHSTIKSKAGYSMKDMVKASGTEMRSGNSLHHETLPALLGTCRRAEADPWLQIEMCMDEGEWQGFVEYMAAPYDPQRDTPEAKPWAYARYAHGRQTPWIELFDRVLFEVSNETWNPLFQPWMFQYSTMTDRATGTEHHRDDIYGMLQEYVIGQLKQSPWWTPAMEQKFEFVIGGRANTSYGLGAMRYSPSSRHLTIAAYNGGWESKEAPPTADDRGYFKALTQVPQVALPRVLGWTEAIQETGIECRFGTYEAGPGYSFPNTISKEQVEQESRVMKSLAGGTATLDTFLTYSRQGAELQNFFIFSRGRNYWTSHARHANGGQAYPAWKALSLYNLHGIGDFLFVRADSAPSWDLPATQVREQVKGAPMVVAYATREADRYSVFLLSRKLDNHPVPGDDGCTPVTLNLPFTNPKSITLYKMAGDPRAHNLDADRVKVERMEVRVSAFSDRFVLSDQTGATARGLPPAATFLYVFEGVQEKPRPGQVAVSIRPSNGRPVVPGPSVTFNVGFSSPVEGFAAADVRLAGTAGPGRCSVTPVRGSQGTEYLLAIEEVAREGTIEVEVSAAAAQAADGRANAAGRCNVRLEQPQDRELPLAAWEFDDAEDRTAGKIAANRFYPAFAEPIIDYGPEAKGSKSAHYSLDGVGVGFPRQDTLSTEGYVSWSLDPKPGFAFSLTRLDVGLWYLGKEKPLPHELRCSTDGFATYETIQLSSDKPVQAGSLYYGGGVLRTGDLSGIARLQQTTKPVEFRLYVWGAQNVCGLGKIGQRGTVADDLVVWGKLHRAAE